MLLKLYEYQVGVCDIEGKWTYTKIMKESLPSYMDKIRDLIERGEIVCASVRNIYADQKRKETNRSSDT